MKKILITLMILSSFLFAENSQLDIDAKKVCVDIVYGQSDSNYTPTQQLMLISMLGQARAIWVLPSLDKNYTRKDLKNANELMKKACQTALNRTEKVHMFSSILYPVKLIETLKE